MMSAAVTSAGASDRDMRNRSAFSGMTHGDMAGGVKDALVRENPTRDSEILGRDGCCGHVHAHFHGITETWIAPGAPSPPTDLIAKSTSASPNR